MYYQEKWENYLESISTSMFTFVFSFLFMGIFGKLGDRFTGNTCFCIAVISFLYFFYSIYRCILLYCKRKV